MNQISDLKKHKIMNPNELRLENLVYNTHGEIHQIRDTDFRHWSVPNMSMDYGFYGIPLIPEIMQKAGFKFGKGGGISPADMWQGMPFWIKDDLTFRGFISTAKSGTLHLAGYFNCQIGYVHQLQNLFFALKGKELDFSNIEL